MYLAIQIYGVLGIFIHAYIHPCLNVSFYILLTQSLSLVVSSIWKNGKVSGDSL